MTQYDNRHLMAAQHAILNDDGIVWRNTDFDWKMARTQMNQTMETKRTRREERLTIRLSDEQAEKIQWLVKAGLYETKVEFIRQSINTMIPSELKRANEKLEENFILLELKKKYKKLQITRQQFQEAEYRENAILRR